MLEDEKRVCSRRTSCRASRVLVPSGVSWEPAHSRSGQSGQVRLSASRLTLVCSTEAIGFGLGLEEDQVVLLLLSHVYLTVFPTKIV